jgi:hypothetical protein
MTERWIKAKREHSDRDCWLQARFICAVVDLGDGTYRLTIGNGGHAIAAVDPVRRSIPQASPREVPGWVQDAVPVTANETAREMRKVMAAADPQPRPAASPPWFAMPVPPGTGSPEGADAHGRPGIAAAYRDAKDRTPDQETFMAGGTQ